MIGGCAKLIVIAACLAVTGCGSSKPEKAFCKAENRVIPDDELMARALLGILKFKGKNEKSYFQRSSEYIISTLPNNESLTNLTANSSVEQRKFAVKQYVENNANCCSFDYDPERFINSGLPGQAMTFKDDIYYREIAFYDKNYNNLNYIAVSMCGKPYVYFQG